MREQLPPEVPVFAKLSPDVTDIVTIASACVKAGASGLTMINTLLGMVIDTDRMRPQLGGVMGGLSGPGIRPVAVRAIWQVRAAMAEGRFPTVPIIGVGGYAPAVTPSSWSPPGRAPSRWARRPSTTPRAPVRVLAELEALLEGHGFARFTEAVGCGPPPVGHDHEESQP